MNHIYRLLPNIIKHKWSPELFNDHLLNTFITIHHISYLLSFQLNITCTLRFLMSLCLKHLLNHISFINIRLRFRLYITKLTYPTEIIFISTFLFASSSPNIHVWVYQVYTATRFVTRLYFMSWLSMAVYQRLEYTGLLPH